MKSIFANSLLTLTLAGSAHATLLVNGDFEDAQLSGTRWGVFNAIPGWQTTLGSGIEIQRNTIVSAQSGNQYVELDSYSNSALTQGIQTNAGQTYLLSFFYLPRTNNGGNDNGLAVYWDIFDGDFGNFDPSHQAFSINNMTRSQMPGWTEYSVELTGTGGLTALSFAGTGLNNSLGAFIDNVSLTAVPEPMSLALIGVGLAGMISLRKRATREATEKSSR
ncbi:MAG: DUF642 domain-containing protein [Hahellaceae bacterium]|nr:DUF642 domain-containing protein [Hahellaceae bacterium]MCP5169153.1 DUF642 domain-containing protein [Hahellaceae bacterium]